MTLPRSSAAVIAEDVQLYTRRRPSLRHLMPRRGPINRCVTSGLAGAAAAHAGRLWSRKPAEREAEPTAWLIIDAQGHTPDPAGVVRHGRTVVGWRMADA